ncbi:MAG: hypothetical protein EBU32_12270 [Opitutaceae bacterium]|nr:hypothetical protein [Opitutaceae bacterium]
MMNPQVTVVQEARLQDDVVALQDTWQAQPPLLVGLIAHLTGTALQEDMVPVMRRLITRGQALLEPKRQSTNPMIEKHLLCPERVRRVPPHFSWVDHRLVRDQHLRRADAKAWALYLVLVTVSDEHGLSYYGEATLGRLLSLSVAEVVAARGQLLAAALIAYEAPLYQVLALEGVGR